MKLNNILIATLPDFVRNFTFESFWENRFQFVRDMHPDKIYYWSEDLKSEYFKVSKWISMGENATKEDIKAGIESLGRLVGQKIENPRKSDEEICLDSQIIRIPAGKELTLPEFNPKGFCGEIELELHKIEAYGNAKSKAKLRIGERQNIELEPGGFVYVTSINGAFIEFLQMTHLQNDVYDLTLIPKDGSFTSKLLVKSRLSGQQRVYENVLSFALTADGYIYVNGDNKLIVMSREINESGRLPKSEGKSLYVKAHKNVAIVLYKNGEIRSTEDVGMIKHVYSAGIDDSNHICACHIVRV